MAESTKKYYVYRISMVIQGHVVLTLLGFGDERGGLLVDLLQEVLRRRFDTSLDFLTSEIEGITRGFPDRHSIAAVL